MVLYGVKEKLKESIIFVYNKKTIEQRGKVKDQELKVALMIFGICIILIYIIIYYSC